MKAGIFDMLGPIMVGPSSSHTAGAVRLGLMARKILGTNITSAKIILHGSFAETGKGHGTHFALIAGLLGMQPDDSRIKQALEIAEKEKMLVQFENAHLGDVHPNSVKFLLTGAGGEKAQVTGCSVGGGRILITEVNEFAVEFTGEYPALVLQYLDSPGMVAEITKILAVARINIAQMRVSREGKGRKALAVIETDEKIRKEVLQAIGELAKIDRVMFIEPLN
ncbi:MAG: L-serine ammonia-lyase, iron-sulfur-dependent, subunit beta [Peptococcaceae bacterium]|nr:L-serine ammonia-lyase, iron-sulfur-dependent, subunit beta [Peptococcaceae bacterium]